MEQQPPQPRDFITRDFISAAADAARNRKGLTEYDPSIEPVEPSPDLSKYFFELQSKVEEEGDMDYNKYATRLWEKFMENEQTDSVGFDNFRGQIITGLHGIDMSKMLAPDISDTMPELVAKYQGRIKSLNIWSTGDVAATGYQDAKISKSGIVRKLISNLQEAVPNRVERHDFIRDKTNYIVAGDKFEKLAAFVEAHENDDETEPPLKLAAIVEAHENDDETEPPLKLVIIEDSSGNFEKVDKLLKEKIAAGKVVIETIWFTGSREGREAQKKVDKLVEDGSEEAEDAVEELKKKKKDFNSIETFDELLDEDRFGTIFDGAHVMVDFDGVIGDNVTMREHQAEVIYNALLRGAAAETGRAIPYLDAKFKDKAKAELEAAKLEAAEREAAERAEQEKLA
ncbi:MAG: hypothetical protein WCJ86_01200 [Candidatus Saccharibacteria bacterium]